MHGAWDSYEVAGRYHPLRHLALWPRIDSVAHGFMSVERLLAAQNLLSSELNSMPPSAHACGWQFGMCAAHLARPTKGAWLGWL